MKTYKITKTTYIKIDFKADSDKDMLELYKVGEVDASLADKTEHQHYLITDEDDNIIFNHTYT